MQALALKYRPKNFNQLIGQDTISLSLSHALDSNRLSHAYLFSGLRGSGKTSSARIFAKSLLCEKGPTSKPCEECENCKAANENRLLDIIEMDAASHRTIDDIRELNEATKYAPVSSRYKIFIIDEVHMLTKEASNAFLKTLEEPPSYVKFILATTDPLKLPVTILSRTQHYRFKPISKILVLNHLKNILEKEQISYEESGVEIIARAGNGSLRDSLTLLDQAIIYSKNNITQNIIAQMLGLLDPQKINELMEIIVSQNKQEAIDFIKELASYDPATIIDEMIENLKQKFLSKDNTYSILMYERFFRILSETKSLLTIGNDPQFVLTLMIFMMMEAVNLRDIDSMIQIIQNEEIPQKQTKLNIQTEQASQIPQPQIPQQEKPKISNSFDKFIEAISFRDVEIAEIFKNSVEFISYENGIMELITYAKEQYKGILNKNYKFIKDIFFATFSDAKELKITKPTKNEILDRNLDKDLEKLTKISQKPEIDIKSSLNELENLKNNNKIDKKHLIVEEFDRLFGKSEIEKVKNEYKN